VYLLDTDHLGILQLRDGALHAKLQSRLARIGRGDAFLSIVSFHEQLNGWQAYLRKQRTPEQVVYAYSRLESLIADYGKWKVASYDQDAEQEFLSLRKQRVRIGTMDLRIAATALVRDYTVLTRNLVDFEQVPGLKVEDWTVTTPEKPR
jgi:tRNA(fMet)-specific endonuclease VapC